MRRSHAETNPARGYTLVELLLALVIALLVTGVLFAAYHTVVRTSEHHGARERIAREASRALDRVADDLGNALHIPDRPPVRFALGDDGRLSLCTAVPPPSDPDLRWFTVEHVTYVLRDRRLYRVSRPIPERPGVAAVTNSTATDIDGFTAEAWTGEAWTNAWPLGEGSEPLPAAVKVRITAGERDTSARTFEAEVYIPAGNTITSTLTRVSTD